MGSESHGVLIVEDNPATANLMRAAWEEADVAAEVHVVTGGSEAFDFLDDRSGKSDAPYPDLLLLDLGLGATSGLDVLGELRSREELPPLPVIVFSGSEYGGTVETAYQAGANAYVTKPDDYDEMLSVVAAIHDFWLSVAEPPFDRTPK